jgi:peptide/nickel transport system permease protein
MGKYIVRRLLMMIPVLLGVTFIVFFIMSLTPGDPAAIILGDQASAESLAQKRIELGLDKPLLVRYASYMGNLFRGDLGVSYRNQLSVAEQVWDKFPNTALLAIAGILVALLIGIPVGILSAKKQYTFMDNSSMVLSLVGVSMHNFWLGLLLSLRSHSCSAGFLTRNGSGFRFAALLVSRHHPGNGLQQRCAHARSSMLEVSARLYLHCTGEGYYREQFTTSTCSITPQFPLSLQWVCSSATSSEEPCLPKPSSPGRGWDA